MLASIAAIAGAITALIGVGYTVMAVIKANREKAWIKEGQELQKLLTEAETDEERIRISKLIANRRTK